MEETKIPEFDHLFKAADGPLTELRDAYNDIHRSLVSFKNHA
jgi:hypothetical protein